jgi:pyruvate,orthophosphate dikinase
MDHADAVRRLAVRANADTAEDAARARRFGAEGIGLCRTEHMFLGERRSWSSAMILADARRRARGGARRAAAAAARGLRRHPRGDGRPAGHDPADRPAAARVPARPGRSCRSRSRWPRSAASHPARPARRRELLDAVRRMHEQNPMLGLRGVRLGLVIPGLFAMQVRAIAEAAGRSASGRRRPARRRSWSRWSARSRSWRSSRRGGAGRSPRSVRRSRRRPDDCPIGTMIELPRAALTAGQIAEAADFFSFGTNDLTQTTWGFSRDDVEARSSPPTWRRASSACRRSRRSTATASAGWSDRVEEGRAANPDLKLGVCGEHGGDPESVHFFHEVGSTTSPARRSASRSPGWRPACCIRGPQSFPGGPTAAEGLWVHPRRVLIQAIPGPGSHLQETCAAPQLCNRGHSSRVGVHFGRRNRHCGLAPEGCSRADMRVMSELRSSY